MKRRLRSWWLLAGLSPLVFGAGGCDSILPPPEIIEKPTPASKPTAPVFSNTDFITPGVKQLGADGQPVQYRVGTVMTGELLTIQSVTTTSVGNPPREQTTYGAPETVHLAGIVTPAPNQPGFRETIKTIQNWTILNPLNKTVEVEFDPKYPRDLEGRRMVQVYFKGTTESTRATIYNLNRMLIRSGYAVADLYSATSIDVQLWLNDEEYARQHQPKPLGLWGMGIVLERRRPARLPNGQVRLIRGPDGKVIRRVIRARAGTTQSTTSTTSSSTSTTTPPAGAPPAVAPPPAAPPMSGPPMGGPPQGGSPMGGPPAGVPSGPPPGAAGAPTAPGGVRD